MWVRRRVRLRTRTGGSVAAAGALALVILTASPVQAQSSGAAETPRKRPIGMDELTITARKREGRLQDVPLAASAFTGPALEDLDVRRLRDLRGVAPNLAVAESASGARVYVRGVGSGDSLASDGPGVGLYLDGVYLTRGHRGLFRLPDIERVEVLRGPQGAQSARSSIGGAVNVITRKPALDELSSRAEVRVGNYERLDTRLSVNVPLIAERAAARVSLAMTAGEGFQRNRRTGRDLDDDRQLALRTQLLAAPRDDLELVLALDGSRESRKPPGYACERLGRPDAPQGTDGSFSSACSGERTREIAPELGVRKESVQTYGASLTARWSIRETLALTSISAWRRHGADAARDVARRGGEEQEQASQELQLGGRALRGKLSYLTGVSWLTEHGVDDAGLEIASRRYAAYGQGSYDLTERLSVTLGARLGAARKRLERGRLDATTRSSGISPSASLKYELSDAAHIYGTWSRGFTSGGFHARTDPPGLATPIDGEELTSYEIGFKSLFLDRRLRLNAAVFWSRYQDIQLLRRDSGAPTTGRAQIEGAELELRAVPYPGFELSSALGVTDARYTELDAGEAPAMQDPRGRRLGTPTYTLGFGASYQLPLGALGDLRLRSDWTHTGRSGTDLAGSRRLRKGKHGELDAQLGWMLGDGVTEIVLFGSNLLDREYVVDGIELGAGALVLYSPPRTYGVEIRRTF